VKFVHRDHPEIGSGSRPGFRQNITRAVWVLLDFLAQLIYHHAKILGFLSAIGSPDSLHARYGTRIFMHSLAINGLPLKI
jgi:hypothetical protein